MFFHGKKGFEAGVIIKWLIGLAILTIIFFAVLPKIPLFAGSVSKVATCGGTTFGGKQGVCIPESQYCADKIVAGCENTPGSPVCCFDTNTVSAASRGKYCLVTFDTAELKGIVAFADDMDSEEGCNQNCHPPNEQVKRDFNNPSITCVGETAIKRSVACLDPKTLAFKSCYPLDQCVSKSFTEALNSAALAFSRSENGENVEWNPQTSMTCVCAYSSRCQ